MMAYPTDPLAIAGIWTAAVMIICTYSYPLYKETYLWRLAEHTFVGSSMGIVVVTAVRTIMKSSIIPLTKGQTQFIVLIIFGLLIYTRLMPTYRHIGRWPVAWILGVGLAVSLRGAATTDVLANLRAGILPIIAETPMISFNNIIIIITTFTSLTYFIFTREHTDSLGISTKIGRYAIMTFLGSYYGNIIMARFSLLIDRIDYLLKVFGILPF